MPDIQVTDTGPALFACGTCSGLHDSIAGAATCCVDTAVPGQILTGPLAGLVIDDDEEEETPDPRYHCPECGEDYAEELNAERCCMTPCEDCGAWYRDSDDAYDCCRTDGSDWNDDVLQVRGDYTVEIPVIDGRPPRVCSIEQELSNGGPAVADMLYRAGHSNYDSLMSYSDEGSAGGILVKEDGSLDGGGGEVVYSRFQLWNRNHSDLLSNVLARIRRMKEQGYVSTGYDAGLHIHISATSDAGEGRNFGPREMAALWEIFSYCESVLYRLGAAGWARHRGTSYTRRLVKFDPVTDPISPGKIAGLALEDEGRYYSINFKRLLDAASGCYCGACPVGDWEHCSCGVLQRGTIEWRVFNATTSPETLHAWLILAHSLTAKAFDLVPNTLTANGWDEPGSDASDIHTDVLGWILSKCPMTDDERRVVLKAAKRAPDLNIDWGTFEEECEWLA